MKKSDAKFLAERISFDLTWLENELSASEIVAYKPMLKSYISDLICCLEKNNPEKEILSHFELRAESIKDNQFYELIDSLRHAFTSFASGGLFDLYVYQSNESWYPKIVLNSELKPNDIAGLPSSIDIYRGCNISEFESNMYGQSWSTSKQVATEFAYQHYASQPWYEKEKRCLFKATIKKEDIFFSRQSHYEKEIAVNVAKLVHVKNITKTCTRTK